MKQFIFTIAAFLGTYASFAQCNPTFLDSNVVGRNVSFINTTSYSLTGTEYVTFYMNFGDGSGGYMGTSISHTYSGTANTFNAVLRMTITDSFTMATICTDTINEAVYLGTTPPPANEITGAIIIDSTVSITGHPVYKIWLIQHDSIANTLTAVDSMTDTAMSVYGSYVFYAKPAGSYLVKAQLLNGPTSGTAPVPTYGLSSLYWSGATAIYHGSGTDYQNIMMQNGTAATGPGFVGGNIGAGANKGTHVTGTPVANVSVLLLDHNNTVAGSTVTDNNGNYQFTVPYGTYSVYPEVLGYATTSWTNITVNGTPNTTIGFTEHTLSKTVSPHTVGIASLSLNDQVAVFPNPSRGTVNISLPESAGVTVTDIIGHRAFATVANQGVTPLNLSTLGAGIYFISVTSDNINYTSKIVLQK